ncbi:hypothetical protein JOC95_002700 [Bacillus tianshenii]|uniref:Uncharacterized protein n=1 Tax=Sutcliffiella tianshenii TaxID=1463404 RepID=A0ABS2P1K5_9BACI|nr:hypothetical protein [Bacillus tianshenii]MBM7620845.1 hypothetical protein [Bacillus tianshenii]
MMKKLFPLLFSVCLIFCQQTFAQTVVFIEVFDVAQSKVVKSIPLDDNKKNEAIRLVRSVESLFPKINATPRSGIMVKVPFDPVVKIDNNLVQDPIKEVIFIFPEGERPYMLLFNEEKKNPVFYYFKEDPIPFLEQLGVK